MSRKWKERRGGVGEDSWLLSGTRRKRSERGRGENRKGGGIWMTLEVRRKKGEEEDSRLFAGTRMT